MISFRTTILTSSYIFQRICFVYYSKKHKKYKSMTYTKTKYYIILIEIFFPRMNNKKFMKRVAPGGPLLFLYEVSIAVLIDIIAMLITPGIFWIQIVNTNMYLINFYRKNNFKCIFPKVGFFKFQNRIKHSLYITTR